MWVGTNAVRGRVALACVLALGVGACATDANSPAADDIENQSSGTGGKADGFGVPDECGYFDPAPGTGTRINVLKSLHATIDPTLVELGKLYFNFTDFRAGEGNFVWATGTICQNNGTECVDLTVDEIGSTAAWKESVEQEFFDGNHFEALLEKQDTGKYETRWWAFGANDAAYSEMANQYNVSRDLFYGCGYDAEHSACEYITEPEVGSTVRSLFAQVFHKEIDPTVAELGTPQFIFDTFRVYDGGIAYMTGSLCLPQGADCVPITVDQLATTAEWKESIEEGVFDGNVFLAIVDARGAQAVVTDWAFGPTDAPQTAWADIYHMPAELFEGCEQP